MGFEAVLTDLTPIILSNGLARDMRNMVWRMPTTSPITSEVDAEGICLFSLVIAWFTIGLVVESTFCTLELVWIALSSLTSLYSLSVAGLPSYRE